MIKASREGNCRDIRALIPMQQDPLEVGVDSRPQDVSNPSAVVLLRFGEPLSKLYEDHSARRRRICTVSQTQVLRLINGNAYRQQGLQ